MEFLWYLLTLLFGFEAPASQLIEKKPHTQEIAAPSTTNTVQERRGGGVDKLGGHGPIIVVEDTHFKIGN